MKNHFATAFVAASALLAASHGAAHARTSHTVKHPSKPTARTEGTTWAGETGTASYYSSAYHGRRTSSGTVFDQKLMTAAHSWLPFGTKVRVTLANSGRSVVVVITDRLYSRHRVVDISLAAAQELGIVRRGVAVVSLSPA